MLNARSGWFNTRRIVEILLVLPATAIYGMTAMVALPIAAVGVMLSGTDFPSESWTVLSVLVVLAMGALVGLSALWASILELRNRSRTNLTVGLIIGIATAGLSVYVTFANDGFDMATTMSNNGLLLVPLFAVIAVAIGRLVAD